MAPLVRYTNPIGTAVSSADILAFTETQRPQELAPACEELAVLRLARCELKARLAIPASARAFTASRGRVKKHVPVSQDWAPQERRSPGSLSFQGRIRW